MRIARKLFLLCAMALTALAFTAGTAAAQESPVELEAEPGGEHCGEIDLCLIHVESVQNSVIVTHVAGHEEVASQCLDEFTAQLNQDGTGAIHHQVLSQPPDAVCTQQACDSPEHSEWPIHRTGELAAGLSHMDVEFCLEPVGGGDERECLAEVQVEEGDGHHLTLHTDTHCPIQTGVESEVTGRWETEAVPGIDPESGQQENGIEIKHL